MNFKDLIAKAKQEKAANIGKLETKKENSNSSDENLFNSNNEIEIIETQLRESVNSLKEPLLTSFQVAEDLYYIPNFLSSEQSNDLLRLINSDPSLWLKLSSRSLLNFSINHEANEHVHPLPSYLEPFEHLFESMHSKLNQDSFVFNFNHVLINKYSPGEGIMPHTDGELYFPVVFSISLQSSLIISFKERLKTEEIGVKVAKTMARILLEPGSLVAFTGKWYKDCLHGIDSVQEEKYGDLANKKLIKSKFSSEDDVLVRKLRTSLTFRQER
eukprot:snap_masked-scaffold_31-processed-gene-1.45-mRNA-1 protein AED:1.00 eAED:1.00 QI:0/-1/0/0/-1/1/1/0/271